MDKQQFIQNDLAIKVAELTLANAQLKAELQEKEQLLAEATAPKQETE
ncbi:hypothetical protein [Enterococcus saccharolyticus]